MKLEDQLLTVLNKAGDHENQEGWVSLGSMTEKDEDFLYSMLLMLGVARKDSDGDLREVESRLLLICPCRQRREAEDIFKTTAPNDASIDDEPINRGRIRAILRGESI